MEEDSSEDEEEDNMEDIDLEALLAWPLKLLHFPEEWRRLKKRRAVAEGVRRKQEVGQGTNVRATEDEDDSLCTKEGEGPTGPA